MARKIPSPVTIKKIHGKLPINEKARLARRLKEAWLAISSLQAYLEHRKSHPKLEAEMKKLSNKYGSLWKLLKKRYRLTDEEMAFAEAEIIVELVIYAKDVIDCLKTSELTKRYLPKNFKTGIRELAKKALEIRKQFLV